MTGLLRVRVDFEKTGQTRWLADPPNLRGWAYVDDPAAAGRWPADVAARLWSEHRAARAWAREFAATEPAD